MKKLFLTTFLFLSCFSSTHLFGKDELLKAILQEKSLKEIEQTLKENPDEQTIEQMKKALKYAVQSSRWTDLLQLIRLFEKYTNDAEVENLLTMQGKAFFREGIRDIFITTLIGETVNVIEPFFEYAKLGAHLRDSS